MLLFVCRDRRRDRRRPPRKPNQHTHTHKKTKKKTKKKQKGLTYVASRDSFITVVEAHDDAHHGLVPLTEEVVMSKDGKDYSVRRRCPVHYTLSHENKGFEGLHYHEDAAKGQHYLFGLCEGEFFCGSVVGCVCVPTKCTRHAHHKTNKRKQHTPTTKK